MSVGHAVPMLLANFVVTMPTYHMVANHFLLWLIPEMLESVLEHKALHDKLQHDSIWEILNSYVCSELAKMEVL